MPETSSPQEPEIPRSAGGRTALEVAGLCADAAGAIIRERFLRDRASAVKGRGNVVTETDLLVERAVKEILAREYPDHAVLGEETAASGVAGSWLWLVDPLDGTRNYSRGIPHFGFNLALCLGDQPVVAVTYDPVREERFHAVLGGGAFLNGRPLRASTAASVAECVLGTDLGYDDARGKRLLELLTDLFPGLDSLRVSGSAALGLAYAAAGRLDLYVHHFLYPWDIGPGILLVREAGGTVTDRDGGPVSIHSESVVAGAPGAHRDFLARAAGRPWRA
ncbi:MAG TPA: inositol monophosphatase family protein [Dehalococcoidia bacterium]